MELNKGLFKFKLQTVAKNSPIRKGLLENFKIWAENGKKKEFIMVATLEKLREIRDVALEKMNKLITSIESKAEEATAGESEEPTKAEAKATLSEAPSAKATVETNGEARARKGWRGGVNKSELIRNYFDKHGREVRNVDLIASIKKSHGVDVGAANVSIVRKQLGKAPRVKKVKAAKATKTVKVKAEKAKVVTKKTTGLKGLPMPAMCVELLKKAPREGLKLGELAELVDSSGYEYTGDKGHSGLVQNVYQAVHNLSMTKAHPGYKGKVAVVIHDKTSKRYRLNPKAKKDVA